MRTGKASRTHENIKVYQQGDTLSFRGQLVNQNHRPCCIHVLSSSAVLASQTLEAWVGTPAL